MSGVTELRLVLTVDDFEQSVAFYRDALGLAEVADWSSSEGRVILLEAGRATLEIMDDPQAALVDMAETGERLSGQVRVAAEVGDSAAMASRLVLAGAKSVAEPVVTPWGDLNARIETPEGLQMTLFTVQ